ncbi:MAG: transglycosylase domain-containing protein [Calditrichae bacterium]|nr:transglycosylase domain-containing protein [Calditrichia bacterium]
MRVFLNQDEQWCLPPNPDLKIPDKLKTTVLFFEDQYFYYHPGVNPGAVVRAFWQNVNSEKRVSGASTITMQVARLFNPKSRNYAHKMLEILQALKMEIRYSKEEILQLYLNHAPYGGNIIGYQAASLRYFGKLPDALTWGEAATIAVLPNAPGLISPDAAPDKLREKRNKLLRRMKDAGIISDEALALSILEPTPESSHPFPWQAPHLSQWLKTRYGENGGLLKTTIVPQNPIGN